MRIPHSRGRSARSPSTARSAQRSCERRSSCSATPQCRAPYLNNRVTHRIEVDSVRGPLVARLFELYTTGEYSLRNITRKSFEIGLRHPRADRRMTKSEIHRMLGRLIYTGDFLWLGKRYQGTHEPLITSAVFEQVQAVLGRKRRASDQAGSQHNVRSQTPAPSLATDPHF